MTSTSPHRHPELVTGPISPLARSYRLKPQRHGQITPLGIGAIDQVDLPLPAPVLELLLARDRMVHIAEHLEVDEAIDGVAGGETRRRAITVLPDALYQVRGDTDVQRAVVPVRKNVDARVALDRHASGGAEKWTLKQVQGDEEGLGWDVVRHAELVSASIGLQARSGQA